MEKKTIHIIEILGVIIILMVFLSPMALSSSFIQEQIPTKKTEKFTDDIIIGDTYSIEKTIDEVEEKVDVDAIISGGGGGGSIVIPVEDPISDVGVKKTSYPIKIASITLEAGSVNKV